MKEKNEELRRARRVHREKSRNPRAARLRRTGPTKEREVHDAGTRPVPGAPGRRGKNRRVKEYKSIGV
jgi:hypothetical protein